MTEYYKEQLKSGLHFQDFVIEKLYEMGIPLISYSSKEYQIIHGENKAGVEIKFDKKFRTTGNFYIEVYEKSNANNQNFVKSGILRNDNTWLWAQGDFETIYIFSKKQLIILYNSSKFKKVETLTSKGFLIPVLLAEQKYIIKTIRCEING